MKRLLLLIFVSAICAMAFPQKVTGDKSAICKILTKEHKCRVAVQDISKKCNETITTWDYRQGYTSTPLVAKGSCICIHYYVDKDTGGSSYYRDLFIPIEYVTKNSKNQMRSIIWTDGQEKVPTLILKEAHLQ